MSLQDYVGLLRRGWWVVLLLTALGLLAGVAFTVGTPSSYTTTATVYVSVSGGQTPADLQSGNTFATQRVATYADLAETTAVLERAAGTLGGRTDVSDLRTAVTSAARQAKSLVDITATGNSPGVAAAQANAVASALTAEAPLLDAPGPASPVRLTVVQTAPTPTTAIAPKPRNNLLLGLAVGLVLGVAIVVVADAVSTRIRSSADLPPAQGLATLTSMPTGPARRSRHVSTTDARLEAFRQLRANLQFGSHVGQVIAVAGVTAASDAQAVARQLAGAFGEIGAVVVVVDVDLRPPDARRDRRQRGVLVAPPTPGVADVLRGVAQLGDVIGPEAGEKVQNVPAGRVDSSSAQGLSTPAMRQLLESLKARFDHVILACPPLVERSEAAVAAALAGSALVVVESGETRRSEFLFAVELLAGVRVGSVSVAIDHVRSQDLGGRRFGRTSPVEEPTAPALT